PQVRRGTGICFARSAYRQSHRTQAMDLVFTPKRVVEYGEALPRFVLQLCHSAGRRGRAGRLGLSRARPKAVRKSRLAIEDSCHLEIAAGGQKYTDSRL